MKTDFSHIIEYLICFFFPNRCRFCRELTQPGTDICSGCAASLPWIDGEVCSSCGAKKEDCTCKGRTGGYFEQTAAPLYYEGTVADCIRRFKFKDERDNCGCLADLMTKTFYERYGETKIDVVAYVPMFKKRERRRGFNQSRMLAARVAENLGAELGDGILVKLYDTNQQHSCAAVERSGNLLGVFNVDPSFDLNGKTVLLVDDVRTSGATLSECGKMLYLSGAERVLCLTAALVNSKIKKNERRESFARNKNRI